MPVMLDLAEMVGFDRGYTAPGRGDHSVSEGRIYWDDVNRVCCVQHKAMLCVNPERTIWRCIACGAGAYTPEGV